MLHAIHAEGQSLPVTTEGLFVRVVKNVTQRTLVRTERVLSGRRNPESRKHPLICNHCEFCIYDLSYSMLSSNSRHDSILLSPITTPAATPSSSAHHSYPNPGFLGPSSHATIYGQLTSSSGLEDKIARDARHTSSQESFLGSPEYQALIAQGAELLEQIQDVSQIKVMSSLVDAWLSRGVNLALAGPFVTGCAQCVEDKWTEAQPRRWATETSTLLLRNSSTSLSFDASSSLSQFSSQFLGDSIRWETLGLFFVAVCRATIDVIEFPPLYGRDEQRKSLRKFTTNISDGCLEIALTLDYLNDLQLFLQYENFIVHSHVDGDQSE